MKRIFVTGIGTDVGKTIVSAILTEALEADYWKPVQAGNLEYTDSNHVKKLLTNQKSVIHKEAYRLVKAASPHDAAEEEGIQIKMKHIKVPDTSNHLIVEGAGGVLVPLNKEELVADMISYLEIPAVLVSRHYLGSINHTLLSIEALRFMDIKILGVIFNGEETPTTEQAILNFGRVPFLGRIKQEQKINQEVISHYAEKFREVFD